VDTHEPQARRVPIRLDFLQCSFCFIKSMFENYLGVETFGTYEIFMFFIFDTLHMLMTN